MLQFYKPNAKNTGCSCTFTFNRKERAMFASLMRQFSWDASKRRGSFAGNKDNPKAKTNVKFNFTEASGVLDAIESNRKFSAYHSSSAQITRIEFSPYERDGNQLGFTLKVGREAKDDSTDKSQFLIGFNFPEARLLKEYIIHNLRQSFAEEDSKYQKSSAPSTPQGNRQNDVDFSPSQNEPDDDEEDIW